MNAAQDLRAAMEAALADDPDDLATHAAYGDFLCEQGDPRGEFVQVQLALEDESRPPQERQRLRRRERELLDAHEREWLGELAPLLLGTPEERLALFTAELAATDLILDEEDFPEDGLRFSHGWARGWLDALDCSCLTTRMVRALGRAPVARLLRAFVYRHQFFGYRPTADLFRHEAGADAPAGVDPHDLLPVELLAHYPAIRNLRVFQFGRHADPEEDTYHDGAQFRSLAGLLERMPRLEELSVYAHINDWMPSRALAELTRIFSLPLRRLRLLRYYHGLDYPLEAVADNPALGRLTHLLCYPHSGTGYDPAANVFNGAIHRQHVHALVASPHLAALTHLQIRGCSGGDEMVEDIVSSGVLKRLRVLDLRHGRVTDAGARLLADCPDSRRLEVLDLVGNRLTDAGAAALSGAGIKARADQQLTPQHGEDHYLWAGDSE
jgi:uncharacterized protein (TIGR02996 family)